MATSGSRNFVSTCDEIIEGAMDLVGALNQGGATIQADKTRARFLLNMVVQSLSAKNVLQLWTRERRATLYVANVSQSTLTAGTSTYDLGRDVLDVMADGVFIRDSDGVDTPIEPMSYREYQREGDKSQSGRPTRFLIESNQSYTDTVNSRVIQGMLRIVLHPVPDSSTDALHYVCTKKLQDFDALTNDPDSPPIWMRCLVYGLASELATKYGVPLDERMDIRNQFHQEIDVLRRHDTPRGSMRLTPTIAW